MLCHHHYLSRKLVASFVTEFNGDYKFVIEIFDVLYKELGWSEDRTWIQGTLRKWRRNYFLLARIHNYHAVHNTLRQRVVNSEENYGRL